MCPVPMHALSCASLLTMRSPTDQGPTRVGREGAQNSEGHAAFSSRLNADVDLWSGGASMSFVKAPLSVLG
jgi:hypothetical protein